MRRTVFKNGYQMSPKQTPHSETPPDRVIRLDALQQRKTHRISYVLTADDLTQVAAALDLLALEKARLDVELRPVGKRDWDLVGTLGGTATQSCVVSLAPVRTRIDEPVLRRYRTELIDDTPGDEIEMPEDDSLEPLPEALDLLAVFEESFSLALPPYPRADGAEIEAANFTEPGKPAMTDDDAKPFAGLAALRGKLDEGEN